MSKENKISASKRPLVKALGDLIEAAIGERRDSNLKPKVLRRVSEKLALHLVGMDLTAWDPLHKGAVTLVDSYAKLPLTLNQETLEIAARNVFHGHVLPVQEALKITAEAKRVYLGKCVCRNAGRVSDLYREPQAEKKVYLTSSRATSTKYLNRVLVKYEALRLRENAVIAPELREILERLRQYKKEKSPLYRIENLWEPLWPYYELLLEHPNFTDRFVQTMLANHKAWETPPELAVELMQAQYHTRGVIFTTMEIFDAPYTICTCPGPENDRGCLLFNWYYFAHNDAIIDPNRRLGHGARQRKGGEILPCEKYPERASRPCLGCGCRHRSPSV